MMALRELLECTTALTNIFLDDSCDDDFLIYHKIDFSEFKNTPCFEHHTPVQQIPTNLSCKAKTIVRKLNQDCCALKLIIDTEIAQKDLTRPVRFEWNVSVINENTEESCLLGSTNNAPGGNFGDFSNDLQIKLSDLNDFIINDSLIFKWTIRLMPGPEPEGVNEEEATPIELTVFKPGEPNVKEHLHALLSQTQNQRNAMKSSRFQESIVHIDKVVSDCKDDDDETDSIGRRMDDVEMRVDKLRESFLVQRVEIERFMSDWEDAVKQDECCMRDVGEAVTKQDTSKDTVLPPTCTACGHVLEKEILVEKDSESSRKFNFLLTGDKMSGKSATGNSILLKRDFQSGIGDNKFNETNIERSYVKVLGSIHEITVVELPNEGFETVKEAFELCPDGFDAILHVVNGDITFKEDSIYSKLLETRIHYRSGREHITLFQGFLKSFGIMIITRGYIHQFDSYDTMLSQLNPQFIKLSKEVEERVLLFDNTLSSGYNKKTFQLASLLYTVLNLPRRPTRVTKNVYITSLTARLKFWLLKLHKTHDFSKIEAILRRYSILDHCGETEVEKEKDQMNTSVKVLLAASRHHFDTRSSRQFQVQAFGSRDAALHYVRTFIGSMGIPCRYKDIHVKDSDEEFFKRDPCLVIMSCNNLTSEEEKVLGDFKLQNVMLLKDVGILVLIDGQELRLAKEAKELAEWCSKQTGLLKEMFTACSERVVLLEYETDDIVVKLYQEATLVEMLNKIPDYICIGPRSLPFRSMASRPRYRKERQQFSDPNKSARSEIEDAKQDSKVKDFLQRDKSKDERIQKVERQAKENITQIEDLESLLQAQLEKKLLLLKSMIEGAKTPQSQQHEPCSPPADPKIKGPDSQQARRPSTGPCSPSAEAKGGATEKNSTKQWKY